MRILHISDCYLPRTGGIESQVSDLAAAQAARGDDVHVLTATRGSVLRGVETDRGVTVHRSATRLIFGVPHNPFAGPATRRLLRELAPDVVHIHTGVVSPFAAAGLRAARAAGLPVVVTWHCMVAGWASRMVVRFGAGPRGWRGVPAVLSAVSRAAADRIEPITGRDVAVLPNAIDVDAWRPSEVRTEAHSPLRVVATQRLAKRKRGPALVDVVAEASSQVGVPIRLTVIGDGPAMAAMTKRAEQRGVDAVFQGRVPRRAIPGLYAKQDVFASTTRLEAFGIAALEARTAGLPVAALAGNGIAEFVTSGHDGFLAADDAELARELARWASEPGVVASMRDVSAREVPPMDWAACVATAAGLYDEARGRRHA